VQVCCIQSWELSCVECWNLIGPWIDVESVLISLISDMSLCLVEGVYINSFILIYLYAKCWNLAEGINSLYL
jgi:hypothetical protein